MNIPVCNVNKYFEIYSIKRSNIRQPRTVDYNFVSKFASASFQWRALQVGTMKNPSQIKNKVKRNQVYAKYKAEKKKTKLKVKTEKEKEREELGELAPKRQIPHTLENQRVKDDTMVEKDDAEVLGDEKDDEFSAFFNNDKVFTRLITPS
jgi:transposase